MKERLNDDEAWDHTVDTIRLLSLAVVQIKAILSDGGQSVSELTESFVHIVELVNSLSSDGTSNDVASLKEVNSKITQGIVAFQFYDRISQRLEHVSQSLNELADNIRYEERRYDKDSWQGLLDSAMGHYTMESEREIFRKVMEGATIEEALALVSQSKSAAENAADDDVEFF